MLGYEWLLQAVSKRVLDAEEAHPGTVLDGRYRFMRPTWLSMNIASREEAAAKLGAPTIDRLAEGAVACFCNWPSYRRGQA